MKIKLLLLFFLGGAAGAEAQEISASTGWVKVKPPQPELTLVWKEPLVLQTEQNQPKGRIVLAIQGGDSTTRHEVLLNGRVVGGLKRGFKKVYTIEEEFPLDEGRNTVQVNVTREGKTVPSDIRFFVYKKPVLEPQKRIALIVANQSYSNKVLTNPVSDGLAVKEKLEQLGYEVMFRQNQSRVDLLAAVDSFKVKLKKTNVGIFYYAGHGLMSGGRNYIEHIGADVSSKAKIESYCVPLNLIMSEMEEANPNGTRLVFWDACRNNPSLAMRGVERPVTNPPAGSMVIFASAPGEMTPDDSPFAKEFVRHLDTPGVEIDDLVRLIYAGMAAKGLKPYKEGFLPEKFYLNFK